MPARRGADIWMLSLSHDRKREPFLNGRANEMWPAFSPNGGWIAYESDETGEFEIYLRRFPGGGDMSRVSTGGGSYPVWNPNGRELFYRSGDNMMAVAVDTEGDLVLGRPAVLFERRFSPWGYADFAMTDGQRFIALDDTVAEPAPDASRPSAELRGRAETRGGGEELNLTSLGWAAWQDPHLSSEERSFAARGSALSDVRVLSRPSTSARCDARRLFGLY
jgi:hypothetical protein